MERKRERESEVTISRKYITERAQMGKEVVQL
jgi:hypothetical protein